MRWESGMDGADEEDLREDLRGLPFDKTMGDVVDCVRGVISEVVR